MGFLTVFDRLLRTTPEPLLALMGTALAFWLLAAVAAVVALSIHLVDKGRARRRRQETEAWRPLLHQVMAEEISAETLIDQVPPLRYNAFLRFLTPYASTISGGKKESLRTLARPFLPVVCEQAKSGPPMQRAQALRHLGLFGGPRHVPLLRSLLQEEAPNLVLQSAARELGRLGTAADVPLILETLDRLSDTDRRQLSSILYQVGEDAAPLLRRALANEPLSTEGHSPFVRVVCAEALRWLADAPSGPVAAALLRDPREEDPEVIASLLRLLRRVGRPCHGPAVRPYCQSSVPFIRIHAARALGPLGSAADETRLEAMLRTDDNRWVALSAANALAELGRLDALRRLKETDHPRASLTTRLLPSTT